MPEKPPRMYKTDPGCDFYEARLDEGQVLVAIPENISAASVHDLEHFLEGMMRGIRRRAGIESFNVTLEIGPVLPSCCSGVPRAESNPTAEELYGDEKAEVKEISSEEWSDEGEKTL